jgi:hypothetical protein
MQKFVFSVLLIVFTVFSWQRSHAQEQPEPTRKAAWISDKGYWVVETNKQTPEEAVVYFYNNDNLLVYKKEIKDQKLKLKKTETLLQLKAALEGAVAAYENGVAANKEKAGIHLVNN